MNYMLHAFVQGDEAVPYLEMLNDRGPLAVIDALFDLSNGSGEVKDEPFWGESDQVLSEGDLHL